MKLNAAKSGEELVKAVFDHSLNSSFSNAETTKNEKDAFPPLWVELYETEGYTPRANQYDDVHIGYGEGSSYPVARNNAVENACNKAGFLFSECLHPLSEFKRQSGQKFNVWVLYRHSED